MNGTLSGHGGSRTVPGRSQWSGPPIGGTKRKLSGIEPAPSPRISHSSVQTANFSKTIGCVHQLPKSPTPPSPGVVEIASSAPPA